MRYPPHLLKLIDALKRFPGVGSKSAERFAFNLLNWPEEHRDELCQLIQSIQDKLKHCPDCGCLTGEQNCHFCINPRVMTGVLCVISSPRDAFSVESTGEYRGLYHVMGGLLSPIDGIGPEKLNIQKLKDRILKHKIHEIVIALDSTLEGDTTALYLKQELEPLNLVISRLAFGLPMGSSLDYVDGGTLARAFAGRGSF
jgi:recombination protein RecR